MSGRKGEAHGDVWAEESVVSNYLSGVRGAIPLANEQFDVLLRVLAAMDRPVHRVLDLGSGDGVLSAVILDRWPEAHATLLDLSEPMLASARERFRGRESQVRILTGDYGDPGWLSLLGDVRRFDVVVSGFSIHHQPDDRKRSLYEEIFRLLEPGGLFVNVEHVSSCTPWLESVFNECFVDRLWDYHRRQGRAGSRDEIARKYYYRDDKDANILAPVELQCDWLREIGFQDVDCYLKIFELAVFGGRTPPP